VNIQVTIRSCLWAALLLVLTAPAAIAATVTVVYLDGAGEGFNSGAAADPVSPAPGATLGAQRKASFEAAADFWGLNLTSSVAIVVNANMDPMPCSAGGAVLGSAGAVNIIRDFSNAPLANTWYHIGLANKIANVDLIMANSDVGATFNSDIDNNNACLSGVNWYYDVVPGGLGGTISFFDVVLHEIGHGIGVSNFVDLSDGTKFLGRNDVYMNFLEDHNLGGGTLWPSMSDGQRALSAIDGPNTHFTGPAVQAIVDTGCLTGGVNGGHAMVYAPGALQVGSSISHWDTTMDRNGTSEIMEPFAVPGATFLLTFELLEDIGWGPSGPPNPCAKRRVFIISE